MGRTQHRNTLLSLSASILCALVPSPGRAGGFSAEASVGLSLDQSQGVPSENFPGGVSYLLGLRFAYSFDLTPIVSLDLGAGGEFHKVKTGGTFQFDGPPTSDVSGNAFWIGAGPAVRFRLGRYEPFVGFDLGTSYWTVYSVGASDYTSHRGGFPLTWSLFGGASFRVTRAFAPGVFVRYWSGAGQFVSIGASIRFSP